MNDGSGKIKWAGIFGICFLLSVIIQQTVLRASSTLTPSNTGQFYLIFAFWSLALLPFFATMILNVRGYVYLAEKYNRGILKLGAWLFSIAAVMMYMAILVSVFQYGTHLDMQLTNAVIGLIMLPYVGGLITTGLCAYSLKNDLGNIVFWPVGVGIIVLLEAIVVFFQLIIQGTDATPFAAWYVWVPVYESLLVIANTILFFRAARD
ncbi:hypothetical protein A3A41_04065 [Candidatus Kaiserbacteria bacterium RIFCSPLOWO2_01_FULL_54_22]|nr:MAG: hypothetical protein A3A41_04065 [Candidatus Kaiserbacteria bacterium RIFCSPLOWO2_01_FULL_54_22]